MSMAVGLHGWKGKDRSLERDRESSTDFLLRGPGPAAAIYFITNKG